MKFSKSTRTHTRTHAHTHTLTDFYRYCHHFISFRFDFIYIRKRETWKRFRVNEKEPIATECEFKMCAEFGKVEHERGKRGARERERGGLNPLNANTFQLGWWPFIRNEIIGLLYILRLKNIKTIKHCILNNTRNWEIRLHKSCTTTTTTQRLNVQFIFNSQWVTNKWTRILYYRLILNVEQ